MQTNKNILFILPFILLLSCTQNPVERNKNKDIIIEKESINASGKTDYIFERNPNYPNNKSNDCLKYFFIGYISMVPESVIPQAKHGLITLWTQINSDHHTNDYRTIPFHTRKLKVANIVTNEFLWKTVYFTIKKGVDELNIVDSLSFTRPPDSLLLNKNSISKCYKLFPLEWHNSHFDHSKQQIDHDSPNHLPGHVMRITKEMSDILLGAKKGVVYTDTTFEYQGTKYKAEISDIKEFYAVKDKRIETIASLDNKKFELSIFAQKIGSGAHNISLLYIPALVQNNELEFKPLVVRDRANKRIEYHHNGIKVITSAAFYHDHGQRYIPK